MNHNKTTALENTTFYEIAIMLLCFDSLHVVYFLHIFQTSASVSSCLVYNEDASQRREQNNWIFLSDRHTWVLGLLRLDDSSISLKCSI